MRYDKAIGNQFEFINVIDVFVNTIKLLCKREMDENTNPNETHL